MNEDLVNQARQMLQEKSKGPMTSSYLGWRLRITEKEADKILNYLENENKVKICNHMWLTDTEVIYCMDTKKKLYEIKQLKCHFCGEKKSERDR
jgi:hypothetical protein